MHEVIDNEVHSVFAALIVHAGKRTLSTRQSTILRCATRRVLRLSRVGGESILRVSTCSHHLPYSLCSSLHRAPRASADVGGFGRLPVSWNRMSGSLAPGCTEHLLLNAPSANFQLLPPPALELRGGK